MRWLLLILLLVALPAQAQTFVSPSGQDTLWVVRDSLTGEIRALALKGEQGDVVLQDSGLQTVAVLPRNVFNALKAMDAFDRRNLTTLFDIFDTVW